MCDVYLISHHKNEILEILESVDAHNHFSIKINFVELFENDPNLGNLLVREPEKSLEEWERCVLKVQTTILLEKGENNGYTFKERIHCRIYGLPTSVESLSLAHLHDLVDKFLVLSGTVVRISAVKILEYQRDYVCAKCKFQFTVQAEYSRKYAINPPTKCTNPEQCYGTTFVKTSEISSDNCKDYQEIKIQEQIPKSQVRSMPNSIWVTLEDDLVDTVKPGDIVVVSGIPKRRTQNLWIGKRIETDLVIKSNHIHIANPYNSSSNIILPEVKNLFISFWENYGDKPLVGRDILLKSFCPELFGLYIVKLAVAVILAGGVRIQEDKYTGVHFRSEPHLLLVGDPGTGKSHILKFASLVISRSVLTTGVGSTAAGLTVAAIRENGEWQLEGGALVMSNGGICCIDEFNSMKEHDRTTIHEAMEQQSISVAKASIVCKLSTKCSVLAATNPKGNLDSTQPLNMNIALGGPLLSRFDLIMLLKDGINDEWDSLLADYILDGKHTFSKLTDNVLWSLEVLQSYFVTIKKLNPVMSTEAHDILSKYYMAKRGSHMDNKSRTTVRLLDSLVRLSQGHARLMFHERVEILDAVFAIMLIESTFDGEASLFGLKMDVRGIFPENSMEAYKDLLVRTLTALDLPRLLDAELERDYMKNDNNFRGSNEIRSRFFVNNDAGNANENRPIETDNQNENDHDQSTERTIELNNCFVKQPTEKASTSDHLDNTVDHVENRRATDPSKKRKKRSSDTKTKRSKFENDLDLLNFIPSVNDDLNFVDFNCDLEENETSNRLSNSKSNDNETEAARQNDLQDNKPISFQGKFKFKAKENPNQIDDIEENTNQLAKLNEEENHNENIKRDKEQSKVEISQNTKSRIFKEKFKFKPKEKSTTLSKEKSSGSSSKSDDCSIFKSQPDEIDSLDLDI